MQKVIENQNNFQFLQITVQKLLKINKTYSMAHKNLLSTLTKPEFSHPVHSSLQKPALNSIQSLLSSSKSLIDLDTIHKKTIKNLRDSLKISLDLLQFSKSLKQNLANIKSSIESYTLYLTDSFNYLSINLHQKCRNLSEQFLKNIKSTLSLIIPQNSYNIEKWPEIDLSTLLKIKLGEDQDSNLKNDCEIYKNIILSVYNKLCSVYKEHSSPAKINQVSSRKGLKKERMDTDSPERLNRITRRNTSEKLIYAQNTELKRKFVPFLRNLPFTVEDELSDGPITETRIKPCENNSNFNRNIEKPTKRRSKHGSISIPKPKKSVVKIPKNISITFVKNTKPKLRHKSLH